MSTVVLYCWCNSDSASVNLYFTLEVSDDDEREGNGISSIGNSPKVYLDEPEKEEEGKGGKGKVR